MEENVDFCCPYCLQHSSISVALVDGRHDLVEDCQNCCEPIEFRLQIRGGELSSIDYRGIN